MKKAVNAMEDRDFQSHADRMGMLGHVLVNYRTAVVAAVEGHVDVVATEGRTAVLHFAPVDFGSHLESYLD